MGKSEEEQSQPTTVNPRNSDRNAANRWRVRRFFGLKCVLVLVMGVAVLLSAIFWLPPFLEYRDQRDLDLDAKFRDHDIVARFMVEKPVSLLEDNILLLENDIFEEIGVATTKVEILSLEPSAGSNITDVFFSVDADAKNSDVSSTAQSLIRASFVSLVVGQSSLRLTETLFGAPLSFEVLKFPGGITIIPPQSAFLLQKVQIFFNFTLNFSIEQIQDNFDELTSQLKSGLRLASYENLYISLTNSKGSTVAPPTTVQTSVLLAVRTAPSMSRIKQLAQTITGSHSKNLGLNNTVFGRVKQVHLSSILQHSLGGGGSPAPAPLSQAHDHHHHHHHHHPHYHHDPRLTPAIAPAPPKERSSPATKKVSPTTKKGSPTSSPAPVPVPVDSHEARPPGCDFGHKWKFRGKNKKHSHSVPPVVPPVSPSYNAPSPHQPVNPPPAVSHPIPASSPLPNVVFSHVQPPSSSESDADPPDIAPSISPSPSSSSAGHLPTVIWAIPLSLVLVLHL